MTKEKTKAYEEEMMEYAEVYKIFLDATSLMCEQAGDFFARMMEYMKMCSNEFIVPVKVIREVELNTGKEQPKKKEKGKRGLKNIQFLKEQNAILKTSYKMDGSAMEYIFLTLFLQSRKKFNLLLITQDINLAVKMLKLNELSFEKTNKIRVRMIGEDGYLKDFETGEMEKARNRHMKMAKTDRKIADYSEECVVTHFPKEGDYVFSDRYGETQLMKKLGQGKEGCVYLTDFGYAAKIYKEVKAASRDKIFCMCEKDVQFEGICWPVDVLRNDLDEFVGYLMPYVEAKPMKPFIEMSLLRRFPQWKKSDVVSLCIDILTKLDYLHQKDILMGDINLLNILINNEGKVYLVDTDSFQIENFPCPVGTQDFTSPEIFQDDVEYKNEHGKNRSYSQYLRTMEDEYFAVAVLMFEILFFEKHPYAKQGGNMVKDNIIEMDFVYPLEGEEGDKVPVGAYLNIWNHLPERVKQAFYDSFSKNGAHSRAGSRIPTGEWKDIMESYLSWLQMREIENVKADLEFFPSKWGGKRMIAKITHDPLDRMYMRARCGVCGKYFDITYREKASLEKRGKPLPNRCKTCR